MPSIRSSIFPSFYPTVTATDQKAVLLRTPLYYHQRFEKEPFFAKQKESYWFLQSKRISIIALRLLSLYRPFGSSVNLLMQLGNIQQAISTNSYIDIISRVFIFAISIAFPLAVLTINLLSSTVKNIAKNIEHIKTTFSKGELKGSFLKLCHLVNSLFYLTIFFASPIVIELTCISLLIQILIGTHQAVKNFKKGNRLEGITDIIESVARTHQLQRQAQVTQLKWQRKYDTRELTLAQFFGKNILSFQKNNKDKVLILSSRSDFNGALTPASPASNLLTTVDKLKEQYDVKYKTISRVQDIGTEINKAAEFGKVKGLLLAAHGCPQGMLFGANNKVGFLDKNNISSSMFANLDKDATIGLQSCSVGKDIYNGIASNIAKSSQRSTFAADTKIYSTQLKITNLNPIQYNFSYWLSPKTQTIEFSPTPNYINCK